MVKRKQQAEPMPLFDVPTLLTCQHCGYGGVLDSFDVGGADDGNVFCPRCTGEIDAVTGEVADPDQGGEFYEDLERLVGERG